MSSEELPLLDLFTNLRLAGLPLGIDEYRSVLRALQCGFGTDSLDSLRRVCRALWVKSQDDSLKFDLIFNKIMYPSPPKISDRTEGETRKHLPIIIKPKPPADSVMPSVVSIEQKIPISKKVIVPIPDRRPGMPRQTSGYIPATGSQMKQSWRYLQHTERKGPRRELDIEATLEKVGREGFLLDFVMIPRRVNRARLLILVDQAGSMTPFHPLSRRLVETALHGSRLEKASVYYFHNCPGRYLYCDPHFLTYKPVEEALAGARNKMTSVLIFSDGGAARGSFNPIRLKLTISFLRKIEQPNLVWLNPMPTSRWAGTTAEEIAESGVAMLEFSRQGFEQTIKALRGRRIQKKEVRNE